MIDSFLVFLQEVIAPFQTYMGMLVYLLVSFFSFFNKFFWSLHVIALYGLIFLFPSSQVLYVLIGAYIIFMTPIRRFLVYPKLLFIRAINIMPVISETERAALKSGDKWVDAEFFSGCPNINTLVNQKPYQLTSEEKDFIETTTAEVCDMVDSWDVLQKNDLPPKVWDFLKKKGFFGMGIPKEYGGLGFSVMGHALVIEKLASRCNALAVTVMVPNSLGPGELLLHYGTKEQKEHYLPKLAKGQLIPCFALTEPEAGSDAASIQSSGIIFKDKKGIVSIKLNWNKRYITLASISDLMGVAFQLYDPDRILGGQENLGITCALVPSKSSGVELGKRHNPMGTGFYNCPTLGKDVIISLENNVIGGINGVGKGWNMLMECLAAGRGISLPALSTGAVKTACKVVASYANIRKQFGVPIGTIEGVREPISRIAGYTYMMHNVSRYTFNGLTTGIKPPVVSALIKYHFTEISRKVANDAMDILGGAAVCLGPKNLMAQMYISVPIGITVEGANILTRTLIQFGQGAMRCHPYLFDFAESVSEKNVKKFDLCFFGLINRIFSGIFRVMLLSSTRGLAPFWVLFRKRGRDWQKVIWASSLFSLLADVAVITLGGSLKTRGRVSGRFGDVLSWLYMITATLQQHASRNFPKKEKPFVDWVCKTGFTEIEIAFSGILSNLFLSPVGRFFMAPFRFLSFVNPIERKPQDHLCEEIAQRIFEDTEFRNSMCASVHVSKDKKDRMKILQETLSLVQQSGPIEKRIRTSVRSKKLAKYPEKTLIERSLQAGIINSSEKSMLEKTRDARKLVIEVDSFPA